MGSRFAGRTLARHMASHPLRTQVNALLHQRPFERLSVPSFASSITCAVERPADPVTPGLSLLAELCEHFHVMPPGPGSSFFTADLAGLCRVRWERHVEAQSFSFTRPAAPNEIVQPFAPEHVVTSVLPRGWLERLPQVLTAVHLAVVDQAPKAKFFDRPDVAWLAEHFCRSGFITAQACNQGRFFAFSDWLTHADDFSRILVVANDTGPNRRTAAGKVVQRLIELDKYRALALLGQPYALELAPELDRLDKEVQLVIDEVGRAASPVGQASTDPDQLHKQQRLLQRLCELTAESLKLSSSSAFRFGASSAYSQIVNDRVNFLQMQRCDGLPSMTTFLQRALDPAERTCKSISERLQSTAASSQLASDLLRTSITAQHQAVHSQHLKQIKDTASTQVLLQESVEGLSVVAITYYSTGVIGYVCKSAFSLGALPVHPDIALGLCVPIVVATVYTGLRRMKAKILGRGDN